MRNKRACVNSREGSVLGSAETANKEGTKKQREQNRRHSSETLILVCSDADGAKRGLYDVVLLSGSTYSG